MINGINEDDRSGGSVSGAGDINGDGVADLIIGAAYARQIRNDDVGESYVVFGGARVGRVGVGSTGTIELSSLDGSDGFVINGIDENDRSGESVSGAGDINGDGVADLIIGAEDADPNENNGAGESYVVFGGALVGDTGTIALSSLDGSDGFVINGIDEDDRSGRSVSGAGDINGDGMDDLIINADPYAYAYSYSVESYVVFGGGGVGSTGTIELSSLDGSDGFVINGSLANATSGRSASGAGDINGDGVADLIIGADGGDPNGIFYGGESYVVFGGAGTGSTGTIELSSLDGSDGFVINGIDFGDGSGGSVSGAGDINGDGVAALIIGAEGAYPNGNSSAGESYVLFGIPALLCNGLAVTVDLNQGQSPG